MRVRSPCQRDVAASHLITWPFYTQWRDAIWGTDITFIPTRQGWLYVAAVLAMYSCKIVGWAMSNKADQVLASDALNMAITQRRPKAGVIHHKIFHYIEVFYNRQRKHSSLGYRSPEQFERLQCVA